VKLGTALRNKDINRGERETETITLLFTTVMIIFPHFHIWFDRVLVNRCGKLEVLISGYSFPHFSTGFPQRDVDGIRE
jgi:hypothetical protein